MTLSAEAAEAAEAAVVQMESIFESSIVVGIVGTVGIASIVAIVSIVIGIVIDDNDDVASLEKGWTGCVDVGFQKKGLAREANNAERLLS